MFKKTLALIVLLAAVYWSFSTLLPQKISNHQTPKTKFSTERALNHLKQLAEAPHFLGSQDHKRVRTYIANELKALGLDVQFQEDYSISQWGNLSKPVNIIAKIKGTAPTKALLLMSHYDSHPHSSFGASDAGSGVVTILEGLRAFLENNTKPQNDIIILITDGEELGLNGADIFVNKHPWAKEVGLVLNFEARGSGGPSYMLIETNGGNAELIKGFKAANPQFPVANSLAYSIYKMLPNDTDLTRFRADGDIEGFNFAFIDDHFDYHTALDTYNRLDRETLEHQGSYLMPLLNYFANANLTTLKSASDNVYFNTPIFKLVSYPFSWILPMLIIAICLFLALLVYGFKRQRLNGADILKGFSAFFVSLLCAAALTYGVWIVLKALYRGYNEILQGFTYNGHDYIWAFSLLALAICFFVYHKIYKPENTASLLVAPLTIWLLICGIVAFKLKGASFFIVPTYFGLLSLFVLFRQKHPKLLLMALLAVPPLVIMTPFINMFPVGLGLNILPVSAVLVGLLFSLSIAVFGFYKHKKRLGYLTLVVAIGFFIKAHLNSGFTKHTPKPNSLVYILNANDSSAKWATYDHLLDNWNKGFIGSNPTELSTYTMASKYRTPFKFEAPAPIKALHGPLVEISLDTIMGTQRHLEICITPQRPINRIELFADTTLVFNQFKVNGVHVKKRTNDSTVFNNRKSNRLLSYYVSDQAPLDLTVAVPANQNTVFTIYEAAYDLLSNPLFTIPKRAPNMIPKPFVLNDATIIKQTIAINGNN